MADLTHAAWLLLQALLAFSSGSHAIPPVCN